MHPTAEPPAAGQPSSDARALEWARAQRALISACGAATADLPSGTLIASLDGRIAHANAAFARLTGRTAATLVGAQLQALPIFDHGESVAALLDRARAQGRAVADVPVVRADGSRRVARLCATAVGGESDGEPDQDCRVLVLTARDLDEESEAERRRAEVETLHAVVATLPAVLFALDREGRFVVSEGGGLRALGLRAGELVGRSVFDAYEGVTWILASVRRALAGERFTGSGRVGNLVYETTYVPTRGPDGAVTGVLGLAIDVTKRVRSEREREVLIEQLRAALALRDEFLSIASHELRTPLASMRLRLELLLGKARRAGATMPSGDVLAAVEHLESLTSRLARLVDALFDVSSVALGHLQLALEETDLSALVSQIAARMRVYFDRAGRELVLRSPGSLRARLDRTRLEQVVENLLSNALKHGAGRVELELTERDQHAVLRVHDEGPGIPPESQARVFDRYSRLASRNLAGLGLGLYVSREIVEAHGGTITVASGPGEGTTLVVSLPLSPPEVSRDC